jgi:hypothetical protein
MKYDIAIASTIDCKINVMQYVLSDRYLTAGENYLLVLN